MNLLQEILEYNKEFVKEQKYIAYETSKYPDKNLVILTCMDTRLTELLLKALNLRNGDAKIVKNAGAVITNPFDSVMRSLLVAVLELKTNEIMVIGHKGCGMCSVSPVGIIDSMKKRGIDGTTIELLNRSGIDVHKWLNGFDCAEDSVLESVKMIRSHPLMPRDIKVHGLIIDPETGELEVIVDGNE